MDFLNVIDEAFQFLLGQLLLLDHLRCLGVFTCDFAPIFVDLLVDVFEELAITLHKLVVIVG